jgi:hypothetical protein
MAGVKTQRPIRFCGIASTARGKPYPRRRHGPPYGAGTYTRGAGIDSTTRGIDSTSRGKPHAGAGMVFRMGRAPTPEVPASTP